MHMGSRLIATLVFIAALIGVYQLYVMHRQDEVNEHPQPVACTDEALLCPDGSAVARQGPSCTFAKCPNMPAYTGELSKDSSGYRLFVLTPDSTMQGVSYAMPLLVASSTAEPLLGQRVTVSGTFMEGNTLQVSSMQPASEGSDAREATLSVGETKLVHGVQITLESVTGDSRCPAGVQCIQAGWVTAHVTLKSDTDKKTLDMKSNDAPHPFDSYQVTIIKVQPEKTKSDIAQSDYLLTFRVDPLAQ